MILQSPSCTQKIDTKYFQSYRQAKKDNKDSKKHMSIDIPFASVFSGKWQSSI